MLPKSQEHSKIRNSKTPHPTPYAYTAPLTSQAGAHDASRAVDDSACGQCDETYVLSKTLVSVSTFIGYTPNSKAS